MPGRSALSRYSLWCRYGFWFVLIGSLLTFAVLLFEYRQHENDVYEESRSHLQALTKDAASEIDHILRNAMEEAENVADLLSNKQMGDNALRSSLRAMLAENHYFYGGAITFKPYGFSKERRLYSAYYSKNGKDNELAFQYLEEVYDYTDPSYDWYVEPMSKGNRWGEPYWGEAGKTYMVTYSALFYKKDKETGTPEPNGVVTIDISMAEIRNIIESLNIGPSGFGALTTKDGNYLYHPDYDYVLSHKNIVDVAKEKNDPDRIKLAEAAARKESGIIDHISATTGEESWLVYEPVLTSGWSLQNTFIKADVDIDLDYLRHQRIWIMLTLMLALFSVAALLMRLEQINVKRVWYYTVVMSIALGFAIGVTWYLALTYYSPDVDGSIKVADRSTLNTIVADYRNKNTAKGLPEPYFIPTGLQIDAMKIQGASDIIIGGNVWQKYPADFPEKYRKGIQFGHSRSVRFNEIDRKNQGDYEVIRWRFQADVRANMDYSRYPLEVEQMAIQLLPIESDASVLLIPDLDAYKLLTSTLRPGLDSEVLLPGWRITETMFTFRKQAPMTDYGVRRNFDQAVFPDLHYGIGLKRIFVDAFISNLTPLIVVLIVLFALSLIPSKIDVGRALSICVAVFFVVVFSHLDIRKNIASGEIFYLEYFFFIVYLAIILVPINTIRMAMDKDMPLFDFKQGIIPKTIYWPSILGMLFVVTIIKFY